MIKELLSYFPLTILTGFAMFLFLAVFVSIVWRVFHKKNKNAFSEVEKLPLQEDGHV